MALLAAVSRPSSNANGLLLTLELMRVHLEDPAIVRIRIGETEVTITLSELQFILDELFDAVERQALS